MYGWLIYNLFNLTAKYVLTSKANFAFLNPKNKVINTFNKYESPKKIKKKIIKDLTSKSLKVTNINLAMSVFIKGLDSDISSLSKKPIAGKTRAIENISSVITINDPKILLLDEPFAALDILTIKMLQEIILNLQSTEEISVVICDHQARDLLNCVDRAIILSNGRIIASGSPKEVISDKDAKTQYFGDEFNIN